MGPHTVVALDVRRALVALVALGAVGVDAQVAQVALRAQQVTAVITRTCMVPSAILSAARGTVQLDAASALEALLRRPRISPRKPLRSTLLSFGAMCNASSALS